MPTKRQTLARLGAAGLGTLTAAGKVAAATDTSLRIGMIATYSRPYAAYGRQ